MMKKHLLICLLVIMILLSACSPAEGGLTPSINDGIETPSPTSPPTLTSTATSVPLVVLTICTSALPDSLFPDRGRQTPAQSNLLAMIQESPLSHQKGEWVTEILTKVPARADGDLRLEPVSVEAGQYVVDAAGQIAAARQGVHLRPSGCRSADCVVTWDGESPLEMDQMVVEFQFDEGLTWSDGTPVTAEDSLFSFRLARAFETAVSLWARERTARYEAVDEYLIRWVGIPGFSTAQLDRLVWSPLPSHLFTESELTGDLAADPRFSSDFLSYGPFRVVQWDQEAIQLVVNPHYHRQAEGLPLLDGISYRLIEGGRQAAWQALQEGTCDLLDSSFGFENDPGLLDEIVANSQFEVHSQPGQSWTQLVFGIRPASYDDGYTPAYGDRQDILVDPRTRQGLAACLDREAMLESTTGGWASLWSSFLPPADSRISAEDQLVFDPALGQDLLKQAGWVDYDANPETPLLAANVTGVTPGTRLSLTLLTDPSPFHLALADRISADLSACGVEVQHTALDESQYYVPGPEGPLFGREFDLALIAWQPAPDLDCSLYASGQVPSSENYWIGTNISGWSSADYDAACHTAALALPDEAALASAQAEAWFLSGLPAVPLFAPPVVWVARAMPCVEDSLIDGVDVFNQIEYLDRCP